MRSYTNMNGIGSLESAINQRLPANITDSDDDEGRDEFFIPTYLQSSTYMNRLKNAHNANQEAARKESQRSKIPGTDNTYSTVQSTPLPIGSHRGMRHQVIERTPPHEENDPLPLLPSRWNKGDSWGNLVVTAEGRYVRIVNSKAQQDRDRERERERDRDRDHEASAIRANHYMPPQCGIYYYEISIISARPDDCTVTIGFSTKTANLSRPVGWEPESWGWHGDDGRVFASSNDGRSYHAPFNEGDVLGCGVNFRDQTAFFTKNGKHLGTAFEKIPKHQLYPCISLKRPHESVRVNFGQEPFVFAIDDVVKDQWLSLMKDIDATDTSKLAPGMGQTELIQTMILQYLQHDGYVETARAFAESMQTQKEALNLDPNRNVEGINIRDDEDAHNRQRIRMAILDGDIDKALKHTHAYYPRVLVEHDQVHFRLKCRKFIELVRKASLLRSTGSSVKSNGHGSDGGVQIMDVDDCIDDDSDSGDQEKLTTLENHFLQYGQSLQKDYENNPNLEIQKTLTEIWSLLAFTNPLKEPRVSHLLDTKARVAVAEELNSAILSSLGRSSRAPLENLFAQTHVLLEDLRKDGSVGAFFSMEQLVNGISDPGLRVTGDNAN